MERKKWTPKSEITPDLLKFREKRKWQLALRRYVLERNISTGYAFYFGLNIEQYRKWIEIQFSEDLFWENFGSAWQFGHIVPVAYFDFTSEEDLHLCWNFINIRVERMEQHINKVNHIDIMIVKPYFEALYYKTGYSLCLKMIDKIRQLEKLHIVNEPALEEFIVSNKKDLEDISALTKEEFNYLNRGMSLKDIILEKEILKKFG